MYRPESMGSPQNSHRPSLSRLVYSRPHCMWNGADLASPPRQFFWSRRLRHNMQWGFPMSHVHRFRIYGLHSVEPLPAAGIPIHPDHVRHSSCAPPESSAGRPSCTNTPHSARTDTRTLFGRIRRGTTGGRPQLRTLHMPAHRHAHRPTVVQRFAAPHARTVARAPVVLPVARQMHIQRPKLVKLYHVKRMQGLAAQRTYKFSHAKSCAILYLWEPGGRARVRNGSLMIFITRSLPVWAMDRTQIFIDFPGGASHVAEAVWRGA